MERTYVKTIKLGILVSLASVASFAAAQAASAQSAPVTVDCNNGQSLNVALSTLNKKISNTVSVNGTCTEYVQVIGFDNLVLKALPGATLLQPPTGAGNLFNALLLIESSRSVTVQGFTIQADTATVPAVGIGHGSSDIRLRNLTVVGGTEGILVFENSQVSVAYLMGQDPGYTPLGIYDSSDVHLERSLLQNTTGALWHAGIDLGASHVTIYGTTISNMQVGMNAANGSIIDVQTYDTYYAFGGPTDVTIESPAGTNYDGVNVDSGSSLNILGAKLVINRPGQTFGGTTAGLLISDGSNLNAANGNLSITGSHGQGIMVLNNSHATVGVVTVSGGSHGGLVVANSSSIDVSGASGLSTVGGNSVDLFCDPASWITGSANISGVPTTQCTNLLATETVALP